MNKGICPVCNGTGRVPVPEEFQKWKHVSAGYDKETDTLQCRNCGGQYMYSKSTGQVRLNNEGVPCTHSYSSKVVGRCLTEYTCKHCSDVYQIDSGD